MSSAVIAQYKYSYVYEGKTISFKKGEKFQLLSKANHDWWQVRRWNQGEADDIYVPANYMKEEEETVKEENPLYENVEELAAKLRKERNGPALEKNLQPKNLQPAPVSQPSTGNGHIPQPAPKPSPTHKVEPEYATPNSPITNRRKPSDEAPPPVSISPNPETPIFKEWQKGYALPSPKSRSQSVNDEQSMEKKQRAPPPVAAKSRDHIRSADKGQKQVIEALLSRQIRGDSPSRQDSSPQGPSSLGPPEVKPRHKMQRPKSYVFDANEETSSNTFSTFKTAAFSGTSAPATPQGKGPMQTFLPVTKTPSPETIISGGNGKVSPYVVRVVSVMVLPF